MSQKKHSLYNFYIESKTTPRFLILNEIIQFEENNLRIELERLQAIWDKFLAQEELVKQSEPKDEELSEEEFREKVFQKHNITPEDIITREYINSLPVKDDIINEFKVKINKIITDHNLDTYISYSGLVRNLEQNSLRHNILTTVFFKNSFVWYLHNKTTVFNSLNMISNFNSLSVIPYLCIDMRLFLLKLITYNLKFIEIAKKRKFKKWKLKKRKFKKLYILKKFKKFIIAKRFKTKHFKSNSRNKFFSIKCYQFNRKVLVQRIPISANLFSSYNTEFYYKLNKYTTENLLIAKKKKSYFNIKKKKKLLIYLRNYHQQPYWKLRKARIAHWNLFYSKTIRKQRYKHFINKFIKNYNKLSYSYVFFVNFFTKFNLSWTHTSKLERFIKLSLISKENNILKLPLFFNSLFNWKFLKKRNYFWKKKIGRWSYLNFKRATQPWLQRKKNAPKQIKHIKPKFFFFKTSSYWDVMTGYLYLLPQSYKFLFPVLDDFKVNLLIKLHMYRYKSNNICMSH